MNWEGVVGSMETITSRPAHLAGQEGIPTPYRLQISVG